MIVSVDEIRSRYPHPVQSSIEGSWRTSYCVGGALCRYLRYYKDMSVDAPTTFPRRHSIARVLRTVNSALPFRETEEIATHIVDANDAGDFEDAWSWLRKGLES